METFSIFDCLDGADTSSVDVFLPPVPKILQNPKHHKKKKKQNKSCGNEMAKKQKPTGTIVTNEGEVKALS